jgi:hypothetical protein
MLLQTLTYILRVARIKEPTKYLRRAKVKKKCTKVLLWNQKNKEAQGGKKKRHERQAKPQRRQQPRINARET